MDVAVEFLGKLPAAVLAGELLDLLVHLLDMLVSIADLRERLAAAERT